MPPKGDGGSFLTELALDSLAIVSYDRKIAFCKSEKKTGEEGG